MSIRAWTTPVSSPTAYVESNLTKLYIEEEAVSRKAQPSSDLVAATVESNVQNCASNAVDQEKQMFCPSTKRVVDEIATKVRVDQYILLPNDVVKRGITFNEAHAETEDIVGAEHVPSPAHEIGTAASGSESPVKKLKNVVGHKYDKNEVSFVF